VITSVHDWNKCPSYSPRTRSTCSSGSLHLCLVNLEFTRIRREFIAVSCAWSLHLWSTETNCLKFIFIKEHRVFSPYRIRSLTKQHTHVTYTRRIADIKVSGFIESLFAKSGGACRTWRPKKEFRVRCWRQSRKSAGLGKCDGKCRDRRKSIGNRTATLGDVRRPADFCGAERSAAVRWRSGRCCSVTSPEFSPPEAVPSRPGARGHPRAHRRDTIIPLRTVRPWSR